VTKNCVPADLLLLLDLDLADDIDLCDEADPVCTRDLRPPSSPDLRVLSLVALIVPSSPANLYQNLEMIFPPKESG